MTEHVLILGGQGRIGSSVAADLVAYTQAEVVITGRSEKTGAAFARRLGPRVRFQQLDLQDRAALETAIAQSQLVIHCAGPFQFRDASVLERCIALGVNYLDVSDNRAFTIGALALRQRAQEAGVTAIVNSGIFPGLSNSMVRQAAEQLDQPETIHLSYVVQGSGGAGVTVLRTTFLALQHPFKVWLDGRWQEVEPYSGRETVYFGQTPAHVYWFDMPESYTLAQTFSVRSVITKFGVEPDLYNHLTALAAERFPKNWFANPDVVEFLSQVSHAMTAVTDAFSGVGVRIRAQVSGIKDGQSSLRTAVLSHHNTTVVCGIGTGSLAELMLNGKVNKPGVWTVDEALSTPLFEQIVTNRRLVVQLD
ncbi:saccharopine dehydrogenase NADP-binding domain-containing protein [Gloeobacter kilaueensis]|uniref:saccharopine dehydrogenase family protein n=1 Tax=Gloeobacter kilaueensis TaxID=1416614 RepID=UPI00059B8EF3